MQRGEELKERTRQFALDVLRLVQRFRRTMEAEIIGRQLIKAATGVAANYRAACRARSRTEFIARIGTVAEEADESQFWLDFTVALPIVADAESRRLLAESSELTAIVTASRNTAKANLQRQAT
jgi:four helix bundle protein